MSEGEIVERGFAADTSALPEQYLDSQGKQFGTTFDVLVLCNLIFHKERVLLVKMNDEVKSWKNKVGTPLYRLYRSSDDNDIAPMLKSRVDQKMAEDVSVEEFGRVAARTQVGVDPAFLQNSSAATALHTAVSPAAIESIWLRASLLWEIDDACDVEVRPDGYVCQDAFWATADDVAKRAADDFFMGIKDDIQTAFSLRTTRS